MSVVGKGNIRTVSFKVNDADYEKIKAETLEQGIPLSQYARDRLGADLPNKPSKQSAKEKRSAVGDAARYVGWFTWFFTQRLLINVFVMLPLAAVGAVIIVAVVFGSLFVMGTLVVMFFEWLTGPF